MLKTRPFSEEAAIQADRQGCQLGKLTCAFTPNWEGSPGCLPTLQLKAQALPEAERDVEKGNLTPSGTPVPPNP